MWDAAIFRTISLFPKGESLLVLRCRSGSVLLGLPWCSSELMAVCRIRIRPRKQEPAIPFPWLDCELSRLKALNWELERGAEDYEVMDGPSWSVNYHDGLDYQDVIWGRDKRRHFEPHSRHHLLLVSYPKGFQCISLNNGV